MHIRFGQRENDEHNTRLQEMDLPNVQSLRASSTAAPAAAVAPAPAG